MDLFAKLTANASPLGAIAGLVHGTFMFPKLEGDIGPRMLVDGRECLVWSLNNYLGLANHPEVRRTDAEAAARYGLAAPMGSRMMSGETHHHEALEAELADYAAKDDAIFLNYGYQGMLSIVDALLTRRDWVIYDGQVHACIIDGVRLHHGRHLAFNHNDVDHLEAMLEKADAQRSERGAILVITEGVFGMSGEVGPLDRIVALKERYDFRLLVDDAHGFGIMGPNGGGTGEHLGVQDGVDLYFGTFAKAGASIGAFVASERDVVSYLRYALRSQIFAKGLPLPIVVGNRKRLELMRTQPELREGMWRIAEALQVELRDRGFDLGRTSGAITPVFLNMTVEQAVTFLTALRDRHGVFCSAVVYPVVPRDVLMLRLIPTCAHTLDDVRATGEAFSAAYEEAREAAGVPALQS
ncbi:MAG TPA: pyridoxal phosphate-dependent aminotransferase family protein [Solirubrobacteraceae bacterium]|jgi:glycine C-acetyltransferase|nr:pyridoxal phosphate-dependent aminotransferase family protein [Solirubrobacteraceae bacterium]